MDDWSDCPTENCDDCPYHYEMFYYVSRKPIYFVEVCNANKLKPRHKVIY